MSQKPYFLWDVPIGEAELRERLRDRDPDTRAQWEARVMREARFDDVWGYVSLDDVLRDWQHIRRHLGRQRAFWAFLIQGWRDDGLLPT
jgi:hypothetical protein